MANIDNEMSKAYRVYRTCYDKKYQCILTDELCTNSQYEAFIHYAKILKKYHKLKYIGNEFIVERNGFGGLKEVVRYKLYENEFKEA